MPTRPCRRTLVAALTLLGLVGAACAGDDGVTTRRSDTSSATERVAASPAASPTSAFADLAQWVPGSAWDAGELVLFASLERMRSTAGADDVAGLFESFPSGLTLPGPLRGALARGPDAVADAAGFSVDDIDAAVGFGLPPEEVAVAVGTFDVGAVLAAVAAGSADGATSAPVDLSVIGIDDAVTIDVGEEGKVVIDETSALRPIGGALRLMVSPTVVVFAVTAASRDAALAARSASAMPAELAGLVAATDSSAAHIGLRPQRGTSSWTAGFASEVFAADGSSTGTFVSIYDDPAIAATAPAAVAGSDAPPDATVSVADSTVTVTVADDAGTLLSWLAFRPGPLP
jgi:hypothetical protein